MLEAGHSLLHFTLTVHHEVAVSRSPILLSARVIALEDIAMANAACFALSFDVRSQWCVESLVLVLLDE